MTGDLIVLRVAAGEMKKAKAQTAEIMNLRSDSFIFVFLNEQIGWHLLLMAVNRQRTMNIRDVHRDVQDENGYAVNSGEQWKAI